VLDRRAVAREIHAMAENVQPSDVVPDDDEVAAGSSRGGLLAVIKVVAVVGAIVTVELAAAYAYFGTAPEPAASVEEASLEEMIDESQIESVQDERIEVQLGEFDVTVYQPLSKSTLRVSFTLWGTVTDDDESGLKNLLAESQNRFREQVLVTIRSSEITDLTDPSLGLIKRKILEKSNRLLGKPLLHNVVFSDFSYFEQ
jgi:flagellar FliL protein